MKSTRCALVTGASEGLGREFCGLAAADGRDLILVARNRDRLEEVAAQLRARHDVSADVICADLAEPGAAQSVYAEVNRRGRSVDVLINNAGFASLGYFVQSDPGVVEGMIQTNVNALTLLTRLFAADMLARASGKILNVASLAAFTPGPLMAVYHATKAYVLAFSVALAEELRGSGVTVTTLAPGITRTEFQRRAGIDETKLGRNVMDARTVAEQGYRAMIAGTTVHVAGSMNRVLAFLAHHTPRSVSTPVAHRLQKNMLAERR